MGEASKLKLNKWEAGDWLKSVSDAADEVELTGVLFEHADGQFAYLMTESGGPSVRFELRQDAIRAFSTTERTTAFLGKEYDLVKIRVPLDAVVSRISLHDVASLIEPADSDRSVKTLSGESFRLKNTVLANVVMR
ncbi:hypothetical protein HJB56_07580 [Rhizobium lentis]|uniref:Uncharacterized protein n=1 Tax=Rhizobium binae TaxID=1138190 RepID=A0ABV2MSA4_9HYPH|nr:MULTISPECIES: hypothetical protein [Rhizobium]NKL52762.1 hypothetical protein [Rhizobium leguminosarum bv. viciae]MBX4996117.1 hypothetical protein [Rhizobium binae]MBX5082629.1 hypothetical protein [Rhizobium lentis]MBX5096230.1 hypothetical protein [Rhizobium lentis]MBX5124190.1 hypothetical protein [Rhizobium lentis]